MTTAQQSTLITLAKQRKRAKGERKSSLTRDIVRVLDDIASGRADSSVADSPVKDVAVASRAKQIGRFLSQPAFWQGPATEAQQRRTGVSAKVPAWKAAEITRKAQAEEKGHEFLPITAFPQAS